jgi:hypothetical protein|nr:MAG TPA: hypothetical protein [Caudoviricetes sp.]
MKKCKGFCANECVTGYCPIALDRKYDWYSDMGYDVPKNCKECYYNTFNCADCIFQKSKYCIKLEGGVK